MARSPSDHGGRTLRRACLLAAPLSLLAAVAMRTAVAAEFTGVLEIQQYTSLEFNYRDGSMTLENVLITHGNDTRVEAKTAKRTEQPDNVNQLDLGGGVQIDFRDAQLEADSAVMLFRGDELLSVQVKGSQAEFSHQPAGYPRRIDGRADEIRFETASGKVSFSGNTSYTDGRYTISDNVVYDINQGTVTDDRNPATRGQGSIKFGGEDQQPVPPPRTPDRSTAQ